jgi:type I restriction enzyme S subunit
MAGNGWSLKSIEELKAPTNGAIAIGPFGSRMKSDCYVPSGVQVIRGTNISDTRTLVGEMVCITPKLADQLGNAIVRADDLVFPHRGSIGLVGIVPRNNVERYALSSSMMKFTCDQKQVDPLFLFYFFRSDDGRHELLKNASTVGTPGIGQPLSSLRSIKVPLPPLAEQKAIAAVLGGLDDKIELNRRMNGKLEEMARALFQSWFVDFDPVRAKLDGRQPVGLDPPIAALFPDSFQDSKSGHIPKGWEVVSLDELASIRGGKQLPTEDCLPVGKFTVFGANGIMGYASKSTHAGFVIAFGRVGAYCGSVHWSLDSAWINNNASAIVPLKWPAYVLQAILNIDFNSMRTGSAQPFIPNSSIASANVLRPMPEIAEAFCRVIEPLRRQQAVNDMQCHTLATLRDTLLPKLLSGELRVEECAL